MPGSAALDTTRSSGGVVNPQLHCHGGQQFLCQFPVLNVFVVIYQRIKLQNREKSQTQILQIRLMKSLKCHINDVIVISDKNVVDP
jgi:hypothetical protein